MVLEGTHKDHGAGLLLQGEAVHQLVHSSCAPSAHKDQCILFTAIRSFFDDGPEVKGAELAM